MKYKQITLKSGDIVEISPNVFVKVEEVLSSYHEELLGKIEKEFGKEVLAI